MVGEERREERVRLITMHGPARKRQGRDLLCSLLAQPKECAVTQWHGRHHRVGGYRVGLKHVLPKLHFVSKYSHSVRFLSSSLSDGKRVLFVNAPRAPHVPSL